MTGVVKKCFVVINDVRGIIRCSNVPNYFQGSDIVRSPIEVDEPGTKLVITFISTGPDAPAQARVQITACFKPVPTITSSTPESVTTAAGAQTTTVGVPVTTPGEITTVSGPGTTEGCLKTEGMVEPQSIPTYWLSVSSGSMSGLRPIGGQELWTSDPADTKPSVNVSLTDSPQGYVFVESVSLQDISNVATAQLRVYERDGLTYKTLQPLSDEVCGPFLIITLTQNGLCQLSETGC